MILEGADYFVRIVDFPVCSCGGMVTPNEDGTYSVYLNARLSHAQNRNSMRHELRHMEHDDFYRDLPIEVIEDEAR